MQDTPPIQFRQFFYVMATDPTNAFSDNWAYLRTELSWLDRMLMLAVARYRQDKRGVDRVAQSAADRVSSHWWKGVVSLDGNIAYDEHRKGAKPANAAPKVGYNQQLAARIHASREQGIILALPALRDRLNLTTFEKNVVLIGLAPEVNRRYARLYRYLQGQDDEWTTDLPTVELVLRLLCRNDNEWRTARQQLAQKSPLLKQGLVTLLQQPYDTLLNSSIKLSEPLVRYLLAEKPTLPDLDYLLEGAVTPDWLPSFSSPMFSGSEPEGGAIAIPEGTFPESHLSSSESHSAQDEDVIVPETSPFLAASHLQCLAQPNTTWDDLVLPESLIATLHHICHRVTYQEQVNGYLGLAVPLASGMSSAGDISTGSLVLFAGESGTGKSLAARAIATELQEPLHWVDLNTVPPENYPSLLADAESIPLLLVKAAHLWLSSPACSFLQEEFLWHFLSQRRAQGQVTFFSVQELYRVAPEWQREMDVMAPFSVPDASLRLKLWEKVLNTQLNQDKSLDAQFLSQLPLNGREILTLAQDGAIAATARQSPMTLEDIRHSLERRGRSRLLRQLDQWIAKPKSRKRARSAST
jgi:hypothetical protein